MPLEATIFITAALLLSSVIASKVAVRFGVPVLVLFLLIAMGMGSEGFGGIEFDNAQLTQSVGIIALVFIIFSGGLDTRWEDVSGVLREGMLLATLGVLVSALLVGLVAQMAFGFTLAQGVLLGATMASTDAAAVFSVLRGKSIRLRKPLQPLLELESGSNDPMAVFLTLGMIQLLTEPGRSPIDLLPFFVLQMVIGSLAGLLASEVIRSVVNQIRLEYDGLYPVLTIAFVLTTYSLTTLIGGNGFLAIYITGLGLGRHHFIHKNSLRNFHDGLAWIMQITMFLMLGLQIFPSRLLEIAPEGLLIAGASILLARPVSVFLALFFSGLNLREKFFISWVGLRGATPIILATLTLTTPLELPQSIFDIVFFVVLFSVILQGSTISQAARWLGLIAPPPPPDEAAPAETRQPSHLDEFLLQLEVSPQSEVVGRQLVALELPENTLLVLIKRGETLVIPRGSTIIQPNDEVLLMVQGDQREQVQAMFNGSTPDDREAAQEGEPDETAVAREGPKD